MWTDDRTPARRAARRGSGGAVLTSRGFAGRDINVEWNKLRDGEFARRDLVMRELLMREKRNRRFQKEKRSYLFRSDILTGFILRGSTREKTFHPFSFFGLLFLLFNIYKISVMR